MCCICYELLLFLHVIATQLCVCGLLRQDHIVQQARHFRAKYEPGKVISHEEMKGLLTASPTQTYCKSVHDAYAETETLKPILGVHTSRLAHLNVVPAAAFDATDAGDTSLEAKRQHRSVVDNLLAIASTEIADLHRARLRDDMDRNQESKAPVTEASGDDGWLYETGEAALIKQDMVRQDACIQPNSPSKANAENVLTQRARELSGLRTTIVAPGHAMTTEMRLKRQELLAQSQKPDRTTLHELRSSFKTTDPIPHVANGRINATMQVCARGFPCEQETLTRMQGSRHVH